MNKLNEIELLFRKNHSSMYKASLHIVKNEDLAKTIVQDIFFNFWKTKTEFTNKKEVTNFLFKNVVKASLDQMIKEGKQSSEFSSTASNIEKKRDMTQEISQYKQSIFMMSRYGNMNDNEIAKTFGVSIEMVRKQIGEMLTKLNNELPSYLSAKTATTIIPTILYFTFL